MCPICRSGQGSAGRAYAAFLDDVSLTIAYKRWPPVPPTPPNLPARRKWIARRSRIIVDGKTVYLLGWDLVSPSGRVRWFISRDVLAFMAPQVRLEELKAQSFEILQSIRVELIS
ncbi:hypothetical protein TL10_06505 [Mycolicibacterium llatzerense]|uniref:Uncharacterized protein n=2 Tax=Mycolicibacterium llatzerense TaxID=280871 RepID=A0A0D1LHG3_9MYCO|nr:hypothetical protein TL10_06505 [Mycolicibacterium llatzerense]